MGEFNAGNVVSRAFAVWARNLATFAVLAVLLFSPLLLFTAVALHGEHSYLSTLVVLMIDQLGAGLIGLVLTGGVTYGVLQQLRGRPVSLGQLLGAGLRRMLPVLALGILIGVMILFGLILLVVPGIIIGVVFWLSVPVAVVERPGVLASLSRSYELTDGHRWSLFGVVSILVIFNALAISMFQVLLSVFQISMEGSSLSVGVYLALLLVAQAILNALLACGCAIAYHDLRISKEGVETEALAAVFD